MFYGQGAGGAPTASAVMGDLVMAARNRVQGGRGPRESKYAKLPIAPMGFIPTRYYVSMNVADRPGRVVRGRSGIRQARGQHRRGAPGRHGRRGRPARAAPASSSSPTRPPTPRCRKPLPRWPIWTSCRASTACCEWKEPANECHRPPDRAPAMAGADRGLPRPAAGRRRLDSDHPARGRYPADPAPRLSEYTGCTVHLKVEGLNPTGSFKDRGMTMAVTEAVARGQQAVLCASTGNTSASAAAYAARAGITCAVLIPQGKIAMGKLAQAVMHGAKIIQIDGNFDDCLELARKITADFPTISLVNSVNPFRIEGQKTAAFEIVDALGTRPTCMRFRSATRATSPRTGRATREYHRDGLADQLAADAGHPGRRRCAAGARRAGEEPRDHRHRDPDRLACVVDVGGRGAAAVQGPLPGRHRRGDPGGLPPGGPHRRRLRRARVGGQHRRAAQVDRRRLGRARVPRWCAR